MITLLAVPAAFLIGLVAGHLWAAMPYHRAVRRLRANPPTTPSAPSAAISTAWKLGFQACLDEVALGYIREAIPKKGGQP